MKEHGLIFRGYLVPPLMSGAKTRTMRAPSRANSLLDGSACPKAIWDQLRFAEAWVDPGPSPAGNAGPYLKVPRTTDEDDFVHRLYPRIWVGDRIWSRETWAPAELFYEGHESNTPSVIAYRADRSARKFGAHGACDLSDPGGVDSGGHPWWEIPAVDRDQWNWDIIKWRSPIHQFRWAARFVSPPLVRVFPQRPQDVTDAEALAEGIMQVPGRTPRGLWRELWIEINGAESWKRNEWCWVYQWMPVEVGTVGNEAPDAHTQTADGI